MAALVAVFGMGLAAGADSASEAEFLSLINSSRASEGLAPLTVDGSLRAHARDHTEDMMAAGEIFHSTSEELIAAAGSGWSKLGENVGRGPDPQTLHQAFMDSSGHRENILGDFNYVGIGTGTINGKMYVTVVFMKKGDTSGTSTASQPKASATNSTTTTTVPPTTTTTLVVGPDKAVTPGEDCLEATRFWQLCFD